MEDKNPLEYASLLPKRALMSNKGGRPTSSKVVNFTPQPKSIISQQLIEERLENFNDGKGKSLLCEVSNETCSQQVPEHTNLASKIQPYEDVQDSFTFHLTSSEVCHEYSLSDDYKLVNNDQHDYQSHSLYHKNNKSKLTEIICYVCSHKSNTYRAHRKHFSVHRNQPFNCNFPNCSYTCKLSSNLIKHKRIHTSEKPYLCDQCTFRSNFGNSLKVHKRIHTSERPYRCKYCSYKCNSSSNLKKHCLHRHCEKT